MRNTRDGLFYATETLNPPFKDSDSNQKKWDEEEWRDNMRSEIDMMEQPPCKCAVTAAWVSSDHHSNH